MTSKDGVPSTSGRFISATVWAGDNAIHCSIIRPKRQLAIRVMRHTII